MRVLIADRNARLLEAISRTFARQFSIQTATSHEHCNNLLLQGEFDLLFRPENADAEAGERAITEDETEIGYYGKTGLLLEDVVREQVLLSLPGRTLCREDCKGLCAHCGQNLNVATCNCSKAAETHDPRWGALQSLKTVIK